MINVVYIMETPVVVSKSSNIRIIHTPNDLRSYYACVSYKIQDDMICVCARISAGMPIPEHLSLMDLKIWLYQNGLSYTSCIYNGKGIQHLCRMLDGELDLI